MPSSRSCLLHSGKHSMQGLSLLIACGVLVSGASSKAYAQAKVEVDEEVKVLFLGDWRDGIVLARKGREAEVQFPFAGSLKTDVFDRNDIRKMNEVEALDFSRTWRSTNGTFSVDAALKTIGADEVTLIKEDLTEITVPLDKLGAADNQYVEKLRKANKQMVAAGIVPMPTPDLPEIADYGQGVAGWFSGTGAGSRAVASLGAIPSFLRFSEKGIGFRMFRPQQELVAIIPVGGPDELVLVTTRDSNWPPGDRLFQSQCYWLSMKTQKLLGSVAVAPEHYPIDYDPRTKLLLTKYDKETFGQEPATYTVWKLEPGKEQAEPIARWLVQDGTFLRAKFGKIVNDHVVVAMTDKHTYTAWDFDKGECLYTLKSESFFDVPAIMTNDRQTLILPEDRQVSLIDAATGDVKFNLPGQGASFTGANVDSTGTKLVACTSRDIHVWDLAAGASTAKIYNAPLIGSPFQSRVEWVDDDHVLLEGHHGRILYRLSLELPVWSYQMDVGSHFDHKDPLKNLIVNSMFFYFAQPDFSNPENIAIGVVGLPGPGVAEVTRDIQPEELDLLKPGITIALDTKGTRDPDGIFDWLAEKIEQNGWVLNPSGDFKLVATMGRGEQQTVVYEEIGGSGRQTVSFQPYYSSLKLYHGNVVVWQSGTSTGAPPIITRGDAQQAVNRMQNPDEEFFANVVIPDRIIDPKYSGGFGVSKLGLRGIEVVAASPPGRAADPEQAARDAVEELLRQEQEDRDNRGQ